MFRVPFNKLALFACIGAFKRRSAAKEMHEFVASRTGTLWVATGDIRRLLLLYRALACRCVPARSCNRSHLPDLMFLDE
jgi:hypothetical protein